MGVFYSSQISQLSTCLSCAKQSRHSILLQLRFNFAFHFLSAKSSSRFCSQFFNDRNSTSCYFLSVEFISLPCTLLQLENKNKYPPTNGELFFSSTIRLDPCESETQEQTLVGWIECVCIKLLFMLNCKT